MKYAFLKALPYISLILLLFIACRIDSNPTLTETLDAAPAPPFALTSWEETLSTEGSFPENPVPEFLTAPDNLNLAYRDWIPASWDGSGDMLLLIPGSTSHSGHYSIPGKTLSENEIYTRIIDIRGMGLSVRESEGSIVNDFSPRLFTDNNEYYVGRMGDSLDENQIIRDLAFHIKALKEEFPGATLFIGGHSSGAGILSRYVEHNGDYEFAGSIFLAPFNHSSQVQNLTEAVDGYAQVDIGALGDALRGNVHRYVIGFNLGDSLPGLDLSVRQYTYTTMNGSAATDPDAFYSAYSRPVLWLAGSEDQLFNIESCKSEFEKLNDSHGNNRFITVEETSHIGISWSSEAALEISDWISTSF